MNRAVLVTVGPSARTHLTEGRADPDARLLEIIGPGELDRIAMRSWIGCAVDLEDEPPVSVLEAWAATARLRSSWPPLVFVPSPRPDVGSRGAIARLARHLQVSAIQVLPADLAPAATLVVAALGRTGLVGIDAAPLHEMFQDARVGRAGRLGGGEAWDRVEDLLLVIRGGTGLTLQTITDVVERVEFSLPEDAGLILAAPFDGGARDLEVGFIAFERHAR